MRKDGIAYQSARKPTRRLEYAPQCDSAVLILERDDPTLGWATHGVNREICALL